MTKVIVVKVDKRERFDYLTAQLSFSIMRIEEQREELRLS